MSKIRFWVSGIPKAQPRMKACSRGRHAGVYDPGGANDWKALVYLAALPHKPTKPLSGAIRCDLCIFFPRPKRLQRKSDPSEEIPHTEKPDRDNLDKAVLDALTNAGIWEDDCRVCAGVISKWFVPKECAPGCWITIEPIEGEIRSTIPHPESKRIVNV